LPIHGFAMRLPWEVVAAARPDALRLRLGDSVQTRAAYPFPFELDLSFAVSADGFSVRLTVTNTGPEPMPYYAGFHPFFLTPPPGAGKEQTRFEAHPQMRHFYNDAKTEVVGSAPPPSFPRSIADPDVNELLLDVGPRGDSRLAAPDGFEIRQTASGLFRYRQFFTLPDEPFFCDEPWMAPPGSLNRAGAARLLPPGQSEAAELRIASARA
jgi:galactose mutarotase-like enzyme